MHYCPRCGHACNCNGDTSPMVSAPGYETEERCQHKCDPREPPLRSKPDNVQRNLLDKALWRFLK